jgi:hypothetical protein
MATRVNAQGSTVFLPKFVVLADIVLVGTADMFIIEFN